MSVASEYLTFLPQYFLAKSSSFRISLSSFVGCVTLNASLKSFFYGNQIYYTQLYHALNFNDRKLGTYFVYWTTIFLAKKILKINFLRRLHFPKYNFCNSFTSNSIDCFCHQVSQIGRRESVPTMVKNDTL